MKRFSSALAVLAVGVRAAAAPAGASSRPSIHLRGPSSVTGTQRYRVTVSGHALLHGATGVAVVLIWGGESCPNNFDAAKALPHNVVWARGKGDPLPFKLVSGSYKVSTVRSRWGGPPTEGKECGYLYSGTQTLAAPAKARTSRKIHLG